MQTIPITSEYTDNIISEIIPEIKKKINLSILQNLAYITDVYHSHLLVNNCIV